MFAFLNYLTHNGQIFACYAGMKARREPIFVFAYEGSQIVFEDAKPASTPA